MATRHDISPSSLARNRHARVMERKRPGAGLTPRVRKAIELLVFGIPEQDPGLPVSFKRAAEAAGITDRALRAAMQKPAVLAHYRAEVNALREGERAANVRTAIAVRDDATLRATAAGQKVRLEAARQIDGEPEHRGGVTVNLGVKVDMPGYVIDLSEPDGPPGVLIEHARP